MATDKQTEANGRNAQNSTGPRTAEGKARSSRNALKTGIHAELLVIYDEKAEDLQALVAEYYAECVPVTPQERFQVDTMIQCEWFCRRYTWVEAQIMYEGPEIRIDVQRKQTTIGTDPDNERMLTRLGQRLEATRRAFKSATHEFERLRDTRLAAEAATEPDPQPEPVADPVPAGQPAQSDTAYQSIGFVPSQPDFIAPEPPTETAAAAQIGFLPGHPPISLTPKGGRR